MNDLKRKMLERLAKEKSFVRAEDALNYAISLQRKSEEDVLIFKDTEGNFKTVHTINSEIAIQLGYTIVYGFHEILYAAQSNKQPNDAINELHRLVK